VHEGRRTSGSRREETLGKGGNNVRDALAVLTLPFAAVSRSGTQTTADRRDGDDRWGTMAEEDVT